MCNNIHMYTSSRNLYKLNVMLSVYFGVTKISSFLMCCCKSVIHHPHSGLESDKINMTFKLLVLSKTQYICMERIKGKMTVQKQLMKIIKENKNWGLVEKDFFFFLNML